MTTPTWHALALDDVYAATASGEQGLSVAEAAVRLERDGRNTITGSRGASPLKKLLEQFMQPLVVVLIGAAALSIVMGDLVDAAVIGAVVMVNGVIGFLQEYRAEQAIAALGKTIVTEATVVRDGVLRRLPSEELVVGDVVALQSGDTVPADLRLFHVKNLQVEEAALTGESVAVSKSVNLVLEKTPLGDRKNLAFASGAVTFG